jgi:hypothetical protein
MVVIKIYYYNKEHDKEKKAEASKPAAPNVLIAIVTKM